MFVTWAFKWYFFWEFRTQECIYLLIVTQSCDYDNCVCIFSLNLLAMKKNSLGDCSAPYTCIEHKSADQYLDLSREAIHTSLNHSY